METHWLLSSRGVIRQLYSLNSNSYTHQDAPSFLDTYSNQHLQFYTYLYAYLYPDSHFHADSHQHPYPHADPYTHLYAN